jgi:predicted nucleic acid-binding protein
MNALTAVISDTGPLSYLYRLGRLDLLPLFYGRVIVPPAVVAEINRGIRLGRSLPDVAALEWTDVRSPPAAFLLGVDGLGPGETEAIALGRALSNALLLMDDGLARQVASSFGLRVSGTVGVLLLAKQRALIERIAPELDRLATFGFRLAERVRREVLVRAGEAE